MSEHGVALAPVEPAYPDLADQATLAELVNRALDRGVVVKGDVVISVAGVDLLYLGLQLVLSSVETLRELAARDADA